jgi:hypothetical protein
MMPVRMHLGHPEMAKLQTPPETGGVKEAIIRNCAQSRCFAEDSRSLKSYPGKFGTLQDAFPADIPFQGSSAYGTFRKK